MVRSNRLIIYAAVLLVGVAATAQAGAPEIFVSNPKAGQIVSVSADGNTTQVLFEQRKFDVEDLVVGPDDWLYACAPNEGVLFRFDPADATATYPLSLDDVEVLDTTGVAAPQCGWFSDKGDLFLTDQLNTTAVWIYQELVPFVPGSNPPSPQLIPLVAADGAFTDFEGQGVTQAGPGDLLFVDQGNGNVGTLPFDPIFRFEAPTSPGPTVLRGGLNDPVGVARSGNDTIFIASGNQVVSDGATPCAAYDFGNQTPQFLQFAADDTLYVASSSKKAATLWVIDAAGCGAAQEIITFEKPEWTPSMSGVALPRTIRTAEVPNEATDPDYLFSFKDHAYELSFDPTGACDPNPVVATEIRPECLEDLLNGYIFSDSNDPDTSVSGVPVTYAGDGGVAQLYSVTGSCTVTPVTLEHAISAYTALIGNPRIVKCEFPDGTDYCNLPPFCAPGDPNCSTLAYCELITLESFFPFNGVFPDDGRIGGLTSTTTSDFSEFFIADVELADGSDNTPGCFCGFEDPLPDIFMLDPNDPFFGLPSYNSGSSVPVKFRVAALPMGGSCEFDDPCNSGAPYGYVTGAQVLLSVAKIFDGNGVEDFVPISPTATSATTPGNIFGNPNSPSTPYHYNLDTSGYDPGVYQAVAVALTDNFAVEWTYFAIN